MARIRLEEDAPPIVRVLGVTLRRAAADPNLASTLDGMHGRVALRCTVDPQAATITFARGAVDVRQGADPDADVTIEADLNTMGRPGAAKPKVKGAVAHPKLALAVSKVLDPPVHGGWRGAAAEFWSWAEHRPGRPPSLRVVRTDGEGGEVVLGEPNRRGFELHGPEWALIAVLTGGDHLGSAAIEGRVKGVGSFATMNRMVGLVTQRMLGEP